MRPGGATALLCAGIDKDAIQLLGRWKSDAMLRYLRIQAASIQFNYAQQMLESGSYTFHPQALADDGLPNEAPVAVAALSRDNAVRGNCVCVCRTCVRAHTQRHPGGHIAL